MRKLLLLLLNLFCTNTFLSAYTSCIGYDDAGKVRSFSPGDVVISSYEDRREFFKECLFFNQHAFMNAEKFYTFLEPYLQEAEQSLYAMHYCKNNPLSDVCNRYFWCLDYFNSCLFKLYLNNTEGRRADFDNASHDLLSILGELEKLGALNNISVLEEYNNTRSLLHKVHKAYYKALRPRHKLRLWYGHHILMPIIRHLNF